MGAEHGGRLGERVAALAEAVELGARWLPAGLVHPAAEVVEKAQGRLRHGTAHTVVALAGPTGSGKSTLFNTLAGADLSTTGVRRPTTGETHAVAWGDDAGPLLDWLDVRRRHVVARGADADGDGLRGLVLLDLPDFDSTAVEHRMEVDRLVELVDLLIWVVDPQKYADQSLHERYLRPLAGHGSVMRFVLSRADTLPAPEVARCVADLEARLVDDDLAGAEVLAVSVVDGRGVERLCDLLEQEVVDRRAAVDRLAADVASAAARLGGPGGAGGAEAVAVPRRAEGALVDSLATAAGIDAVGDAAARQYRRDAAGEAGWPPLRWVSRVRRSPLATLPSLGRSDVALAGVGSALRRFAESVGDDLGPPWSDVVRSAVLAHRDELVRHLGHLTGANVRRPPPPRWWRLANWVQTLLVVVAAVGLVWLVALALVESLLRLDVEPFVPHLGSVPVPTVLFLGGVAAGLLVALVGRAAARVGGRRRGADVRRHLRRDVERVAVEQAVRPLEALLDERRAFAGAVAVASAR